LPKVNLLPPELRRTRRSVLPQLRIQGSPLSLIFLGLSFLAVGIFLDAVGLYQKKEFKRLNTQYNQQYRHLEDLAKKKDALEQKLNRITLELNLLSGYLERDLVWSDKLNQLRNLFFKEVWLTELYFEKKGAKAKETEEGNLYLKGGLAPQRKSSPIGTLSRFITQLKEDKAFFSDFDNLTLTDFKTDRRNNTEITNFTIRMSFKKKVNPPDEKVKK